METAVEQRFSKQCPFGNKAGESEIGEFEGRAMSDPTAIPPIFETAYHILIQRRHISDDRTSELETVDGKSPWAIVPSHGGGIAEENRSSLPSRLIVKSGSDNVEFQTIAASYFAATDNVKLVLKKLDPTLEFYPLEVVDLVQRRAHKIWLMHCPHRVQMINLEAAGAGLIVKQSPPEIINGRLCEFEKSYRVYDHSKLVIDRAAVEGLHLWSGIPTSLSGWYCSEEFKRAVEPFRCSFGLEPIRVS